MSVLISRLMPRIGLVFSVMWRGAAAAEGAVDPVEPADPRAAVVAAADGAILAGYRAFDEPDATPPQLWRRLNEDVSDNSGAMGGMHGGMADQPMTHAARDQTASHGKRAGAPHQAREEPTPADHAAMGHGVAPPAQQP
ncbi:MAG: hypothetical protein V4754_18630 [Pseudomonadota bacterium]